MKTTFVAARHLTSRAGFGARPAELSGLIGKNYEGQVERMLRRSRTKAFQPLPSWSDEKPPPPQERRELGKAFRKKMRKRGLELKVWWFTEMLATPSPLSERMTLLWSNHFTSSLRKVKWPGALLGQNVTLRRHALGSFRDMLLAVVRDPAMILYLDNQTNHKDEPNENFARELLELFTLGEGHYTEKDIKEAARAFTGYRVNRYTAEFRFSDGAHDKGPKTFMGKTGRFDGDDLVDILLDNPRTAEFIVEKLWREFVSPEPDARVVQRWAKDFRRARYQLQPLMKTILTSEPFLDSQNRGTLIKSPIDLFVGLLRQFQVTLPDKRGLQVARGLRRLGQDLFDPPNVKGWEGGVSWITTNTLLLRQAMTRGALQSKPFRQSTRRLTLRSWLGEEKLSDGDAAQRAQAVLTPIEPVGALDTSGEEALLTSLVLDPAYQLK